MPSTLLKRSTSPYLPSEILFQILSSLVPPDTSRSLGPSASDIDLLSASLACRSWRAVGLALLQKRKWYVLDLESGWRVEDVVRLAGIVEEAERAGLSARSVVQGVDRLILDPTHAIDLDGFNTPFAAATLLLLHTLRLQTLELHSAILPPTHTSDFLLALSLASAHTQTLHLHTTYLPSDLHSLLTHLHPLHLHLTTPHTLTPGHLPALTTLAATLETLTLRLPTYTTPCPIHLLAKLLRRLPHLRHFALQGLPCSDDGPDPLLNAIASSCPNLQTLCLPDMYSSPPAPGYTPPGATTPRLLTSLVRSCKSIRVIDLTGHTLLDSRFLALLARHLPGLQEIVLAGCGGITDVPISEGETDGLWPDLRVLDLTRGSHGVSSGFLWRIVYAASRLRVLGVPEHLVVQMEFRARLAGAGFFGGTGGRFQRVVA